MTCCKDDDTCCPPSLSPHPGSMQEQAAATILYCAAHPSLSDVSGLYWHECHPVEPSADALDPELGEGLWDFSERLIQERIGTICSSSGSDL